MSRYQRQIILPGFGEESQKKLNNSKVLVVGAGGLGCPVLQFLAAAGVGTLGIVDFDSVSITNLHRQTLFSESDLDRKKVEAIREKLSQLNSELNYEIYDFALQTHNVVELINQYEIIVDCTDVLATKYLINDVCALLKKPLVYASIYQYEGQISVFHYGENSRNLRDLFPEIPNSNSVVSCEEAGVLGILTGIMGNFQANEVLKIITGNGEVLSGKIMIYNCLKNEFQNLFFPSNPEVFTAKNPDEILNQHYEMNCKNFIQIDSLNDLNEILKNKNAILIDVRNKDELPKIVGFEVKEIPLNELEENMDELKNHENLIFLCQKGIRSVKAIQFIQSKSIENNLYNIKNGISIFQ